MIFFFLPLSLPIVLLSAFVCPLYLISFIPKIRSLIYNLSAGAEGERPPAHEKLPDPRHRRRVQRRGRRQQQEAVKEARRPLHPAGPEEAALHPGRGEAQDALQETHQDHPQGTA